MGKFISMKGIYLTLIISFIIGWNVISSADEWDKMHIRKFDPRLDLPEVSLKSLDDKKVTLDDYKGKVIFLNFWTTWCGYCKREMPSMERLYKEFKDKGLVILAVDVKESATKVKSFWDRYDLTFPTTLDPRGRAAWAFGVRGYPATFLIDRHGKLVGSAPGAREWYCEDFKTIISNLLEEKGPEGKSVKKESVGNKAESGHKETPVDQKSQRTTLDLNSIPGPPAYSKGQMNVESGQLFDFDRGGVSNDRAADFSWSEVGLSTRYLIPQNGAEFSNKGVIDKVTFDEIVLAEYSGAPINGSEGEKNKLKPGTVLYARTNEGRYACFRVETNGRSLEINWVTYEKN